MVKKVNKENFRVIIKEVKGKKNDISLKTDPAKLRLLGIISLRCRQN